MEKTIVATDLCKSFIKRSKVDGRRFFRRTKKEQIEVVSNLTISANAGEILGFIGPNGAGKSTTIKMLSGILEPTSGSIKILSKNPILSRTEVSKNISVVFGQRSQLWFHLTPDDSFKLLKRIYRIESSQYQKTLNELVERLDIAALLETPLRQLSLGQRMRCELAGSLLHRPKIIFLDEPTIGLDVVAKRAIRDFVIDMAKNHGTTVFLTSHDVGDLESMCDSIAIINKGHLLYSGKISKLKKMGSHQSSLDLHTKNTSKTLMSLEKEGFPGTRIQEGLIKVDLNEKYSAVNILEKVLSFKELDDISIHKSNLEDLIREIYASGSMP